MTKNIMKKIKDKSETMKAHDVAAVEVIRHGDLEENFKAEKLV